MTNLCLECTKRYYFNVYIQNFLESMPPDPPPPAWHGFAMLELPQDQPLDTALLLAFIIIIS